MHFKSNFIIFICLLISLNGISQEKKEKPRFFNMATIEDHLELNVGYVSTKLKDQATSPLLHNGSGIQGDINYFVLSPRWCASVELNANFSTLGNKYESTDVNPMISIFTDINLLAGFKIKDFNKIKLYLGPKINYLSNQWAKENYSNSYFQYNSSLVIGPYIYTERSIYFKGDIREVNGTPYKYPPNLKVSLAVSVPLMGMFSKPMYHGFTDISNPDADFMSTDSASHPALIGVTMLLLESKLNVDYNLKNGNSIRLSYWWKFHEFKEENYCYQYAIQGVSLSFLFRFDKNTARIEPLKNEL